jgi:hypothetical protein
MKIRSSMKALSLAVIGLAGLGFGAQAMAACPSVTGTGTGADPYVLTPWSGVTQSAAAVRVDNTGGLNSTLCKLGSKITANSAFAQGTVFWTGSGSEANYRARFYVQPDLLSGSLGAFDGVQLFTANAAAPFPAGQNPSVQIVRVTLTGGGATGRQLGFVAACQNGGGNTCPGVSVPLTNTSGVTGPVVVEMQVTIGAAGTGSVKYWVNKTAGDSAAPTGTIAITGGNAGWVGVNKALLGLSAPTVTIRTAHLNQEVFFDEFDSRRTNYIGP